MSHHGRKSIIDIYPARASLILATVALLPGCAHRDLRPDPSVGGDSNDLMSAPSSEWGDNGGPGHTVHPSAPTHDPNAGIIPGPGLGYVPLDDEYSQGQHGPSRGSISYRKVDTAISAHWDEVNACYTNVLSGEKKVPEGNVDLEIIVGKNGHARSARLTYSAIQAPKVENCLLGVVRSVDDFPAPDDGDEALVNYSFYFSSRKK